MALISIDRIAPGDTACRWDAEYFANDYRRFVARAFATWPEWVSLRKASTKLTSGHTPLKHDMDTGDCDFLTVECVSPLAIHFDLAKRVWRTAVDGELRRVRLAKGDVLVTIKRRIVDSCPVAETRGPTAVNQDVAVMTPTVDFLPGFVSAFLVSRIGKSQAFRNQTEQMNPYLSVGSLGGLMIPVVGLEEQRQIEAIVEARSTLLRRASEYYAEAEAIIVSSLELEALVLAPKLFTLGTFGSTQAAARLDAEFFCWPELAGNWKSPFPLQPLGDPSVSGWLSNGATPAASEYSDAGIPIVKVGGVTNLGTVEWLGDRVRADARAASGMRGEAKVGDVFMLCAAHHIRYIGKSGVLRALPAGPACRSVGELITVRAAGAVEPEVLCTYFNLSAVRTQIQRFVRGQSAHLYPSDLQHLPVPILPESIQKQIVRLHEKSDAARREAAELLEDAKVAVEALILGDNNAKR